MAKGGRYLDTSKNPKKKGKGGKVLVIVLLILALLIGGGYFAFRTFMGSLLGNVNRAEVIEQNQDKSYDDLMAELYGSMDFSNQAPVEESPEAGETEAQEETEAPSAETTAAAG